MCIFVLQLTIDNCLFQSPFLNQYPLSKCVPNKSEYQELCSVVLKRVWPRPTLKFNIRKTKTLLQHVLLLVCTLLF